MKRHFFAALALVAGQLGRPTQAQDAEDAPQAETGRASAGTRTMGGKQFWADELFFHDWHIQRNVLTNHCRLLDGAKRRHAWGSFAECRSRLDDIRSERSLPAMQGKAVIVMHGLFRSSSSMSTMARHLAENGKYTVVCVSYPSTRAEIESHAKGLASIIRHLDGIEEINFVAHSLGNMVIRRYLADAADPKNGGADPRIRRMVMLGAPNQGARLAEVLGKNPAFDLIAGASAVNLGLGWTEASGQLAIPNCDFGIIAGGRGDDKGYNPLLPGDDDLVVAVEETKLPGARDFEVLPVRHTFMMNDPVVLEHTLRFLQEGHFVAEDQRRPIAKE